MDLEQQVVRFDNLIPSTSAFIDTHTPGSHLKQNYCIIGKGVSEDKAQHIHLDKAFNFHFGAAAQPAGIKNSLHAHNSSEIFIVYQGQFRIYWGNQGQHEIILNPCDILAVPPNLFRGFEVVSECDGFAFVILGGKDAGGPLTWHPDVITESQGHGLYLKKNGKLANTLRGDSKPSEDELVNPLNSVDMAQFYEPTPDQLKDNLVCLSEYVSRPLSQQPSPHISVFSQALTHEDTWKFLNNIHICSYQINTENALTIPSESNDGILLLMQGYIECTTSEHGDITLYSGDTFCIPKD
ncbi:MAG: hypothetical protein OXE99_02755, partial [Cellvibrionales bacterium]|nr:hypothetical protein [Cellvibrionales bacterium]